MRMPFGLCNAPATFQHCMLNIFSDMVERFPKIFMDDFFIFDDSFDQFLHHLTLVLQRCIEKNLVLNWEKCHFMVKQGIVLGHQKIKRKLLSLAFLTLLHIWECHLDYVMHPLHFNDACWTFFLIWLNDSLKFLWMTFLSLVIHLINVYII